MLFAIGFLVVFKVFFVNYFYLFAVQTKIFTLIYQNKLIIISLEIVL